jgi:hypothetical protein
MVLCKAVAVNDLVSVKCVLPYMISPASTMKDKTAAVIGPQSSWIGPAAIKKAARTTCALKIGVMKIQNGSLPENVLTPRLCSGGTVGH